eukprot:3861375-Amphidinium_carterae.1
MEQHAREVKGNGGDALVKVREVRSIVSMGACRTCVLHSSCQLHGANCDGFDQERNDRDPLCNFGISCRLRMVGRERWWKCEWCMDALSSKRRGVRQICKQ